jgi:hypothetical protein
MFSPYPPKSSTRDPVFSLYTFSSYFQACFLVYNIYNMSYGAIHTVRVEPIRSRCRIRLKSFLSTFIRYDESHINLCMSVTLSASLLNTQISLAFVLLTYIPNPDAHGHSSPYIFGMGFRPQSTQSRKDSRKPVGF